MSYTATLPPHRVRDPLAGTLLPGPVATTIDFASGIQKAKKRRFWTSEEEKTVRSDYPTSKPVAFIALALERSIGAVRSKA
ncbi:MAG: hypothetical protein ABF479_15805, partial [Gluconacetobacter sp.]